CRLPCSHASHPCAGELFSLSMIKASQGKYHRRWAPCTRPHTSWTGAGLPRQVCQGDSIVSSLGHRALEGVSDLLILHTITAFGGVGTFRCTKEPYRLVHCAHQERTWRKTRAPLSQNMPRNSPTRCADTVTSAHGRADSLRISCLWVQRRGQCRDREGVHGEPRGHSYANRVNNSNMREVYHA